MQHWAGQPMTRRTARLGQIGPAVLASAIVPSLLSAGYGNGESVQRAPDARVAVAVGLLRKPVNRPSVPQST